MKHEQGFKSRIGFILAAAGSAVGLGNLWAFPYKAGMNGGAIFVLVYIVMAIIIGFVGMVAEIYIGKRTGKNIIDSYKEVSPRLSWAGILGVILTVLITSYYIVLGGWVLKYATSYLIGTDLSINGSYEAYFNNFISGGIEPIIYTAIFFIIAMLILLFGVEKGIERISKVLLPVLFILMIVLTVRSLTLGEGVLEGILFYIKPDFTNIKGSYILAAMGQAFFSLSLGVGIMVSYGSYASKQKGIAKSACSVVILDTLVALLSGFMIFPAVFHFNKAPTGGPGLFFIVMPEIFDGIFAGRLFGFIFFALVFIAAITSVISLVEVSLQTVTEKTKIKRPKAILMFLFIIIGLGSLVSLSQGFVKGLQIHGMDLLTFFDTLISQYMMPLGTIICCIIVGWLISRKELNEAFNDFKYRNVWLFFTKYITPILVGLILFFGIFKFNGGFGFANDWIIVLIACLLATLLPLINCIYLYIKKKKLKNI